jgi:hypothetical protein
VNEQEARVPLLIHLPEGATGRHDFIVQPQDIAATLLALGGVSPPPGWVGHNLLESVKHSCTGREIAVAGQGVTHWQPDPDRTVFTVFDGRWYLNLAANPEACRLYQMGSVVDVAAAHPEIVARLRESGIGEAERRGTDPKLVAWLRSDGMRPFPDETVQWFGPQHWRQYWERVYEE